MPSAAYRLFIDAIVNERQVACSYDGARRDLCPIVLGHSKGEEKVLAYQVGGTNSRGQPVTGQWKCLSLAKVQNPRLQDGPWREGDRHQRTQSCVEDVDIDINIHVRKRR